MLNVRANIRYVRALYSLGETQQVHDQIYEDMKYLRDLFRESKELRVLMANPTIPNRIKQSVLKKLFENKLDSLSVRFLDMLVRKNRENDVFIIASIYVHIYSKRNKISRAEVVSVIPLDEDIKQEIISKVKTWGAEDVELTEKIDTGLIGGFTLKVDGKYIDLSVKSRIRSLEKELKKTVYQKQ